MNFIAPLQFIQEHTTVERIVYGKYRVVVNIRDNNYTNITTNIPAFERIRCDYYLSPNVKGSGGLTVKQAYHAIMSDIQIIQLNDLYRELQSL